jgi:hypothetical protein
LCKRDRLVEAMYHWEETVARERVGQQLPHLQPARIFYVGAALAAGLA